MPKIFISYRREDTDHITGRIHDRLESHFGRDNVFLDIDAIPLGVDFREHLDQAVGQCNVLLVVIGEGWLNVCHPEGPKKGQRRLDDPGDFVRLEIQSALTRGIPVIPVLVGRAAMPSVQMLPEGLKNLAFRNATEVRSGRDFRDHVDRLVRGIEYLLRTKEDTSKQSHREEESERTDLDKYWEERGVKLTAIPLGDGIKMKLAFIPPGTFLMGSPPGEMFRSDDEVQHTVTLTKGFWLGVYPVTQAQWLAVMDSNPSNFKGADRPVEMVSWLDFNHFCQNLMEKTKQRFRLPTESEWEYACRAGTTTAYYTGNDLEALKRAAWCSHDGIWASARETKPVGQLGPNAWGLYDMHGNVWEWCNDWIGAYPTIAVTDPPGRAKGKRRVLRGGSWSALPGACRSASRFRGGIAYRDSYFGCRVCLDTV